MQNDTKIDQQVRENDRNGKEKMKMNADKFNHAKEHIILVGDTVLVRSRKITNCQQHLIQNHIK